VCTTVRKVCRFYEVYTKSIVIHERDDVLMEKFAQRCQYLDEQIVRGLSDRRQDEVLWLDEGGYGDMQERK